MSVENMHISSEAAELEAEKVLRFDIGNIPHLGEAEMEDGNWVFPVNIRIPRVVFDREREDPIDVRFMSENTIGEISIDGETGELVNRTNLTTIQKEIRKQKRVVEEAVQKALVKASAKDFSRLPYPEHRYTPVQDLLSVLILEGEISEETFDTLSSDDKEKYLEHLETLINVDLVEDHSGFYSPGDALIEIQAGNNLRPSEELDAAMAHLFETGADDIDVIQEILGPFLHIAGYYYRRALESEQLPEIRSQEFQDVVRRRYSGQKKEEKAFKLARYLIQLEKVGILTSDTDRSGRIWRGEDDVRSDLLRQQEQLQPIQELIA